MMLQIQNITNDPLQSQNFILPDGTSMQIVMQFNPLQFGWFIQSLTYGTFVLQGRRICVSPNMLHQFKNILPFGLACFSNSKREPNQQNDFTSGAATLYVLTAAEVAQYTRYLGG